jgi:hypothetical protein
MDLWRYGKFRKRQTVSYGSEPRIPVQKIAELMGLMGCEGGVTESDARIKSRLTWPEGYRKQASDTIPPKNRLKSLCLRLDDMRLRPGRDVGPSRATIGG